MADSRLRQLERRWKETGCPESEAAFMREQIRVGERSNQHVWIAAKCGHPASRLIHQTARVTNWLEVEKHFGKENVPNHFISRVAIEACRHYRRFWNLMLPIENPQHWVEAQGGRAHYWMDEEERRIRLQMMLDGEEINAAVPLRYLSETYPGFNGGQHWTEMLTQMRHLHFRNGRDYIINKRLWHYVEYLEEFLQGKHDGQERMFGAMAVRDAVPGWDCEWLYHLLEIPIDISLDNYRGCLTRCLSADRTHEAINQGVIRWALT